MNAKMIDKDFLLDIGRYLFDGLLVSLIWVKSNITLLNIGAENVWTETFGEYAQITKLSFQVILTVIIAVTAFYRMLIVIRKFRQGKKDKKNG